MQVFAFIGLVSHRLGSFKCLGAITTNFDGCYLVQAVAVLGNFSSGLILLFLDDLFDYLSAVGPRSLASPATWRPRVLSKRVLHSIRILPRFSCPILLSFSSMDPFAALMINLHILVLLQEL